MKNLFWLLIILAGCTVQEGHKTPIINLAGEWKFRIDSLDKGITEKWYTKTGNETVRLPGSMAENGKGEDVSLRTHWTGEIVNKSYFNDKKYEEYRKQGNIKIPFWFKPVKYYKGVAWFQKEVELPSSWNGQQVILSLERCHWKSELFVNDKKAGSRNSLATPHEYDITDLVTTGRNLISIRIDNRIEIPVGVNSNSISDQTQTNWNGIAGNINLTSKSQIHISDVKVFPDLKNKSARVIVVISNKKNEQFKGSISIKADSYNSKIRRFTKTKFVKVNSNSWDTEIITEYPMKNNFLLWNEYNPALYKLSVELIDERGRSLDDATTDFGMREFKANGTEFELNGKPVFLRGTNDCCIFPLTGYPPTDIRSWKKVLQTYKDYGLNHVRFNSWCPPEAAFAAADEIGMFLQVECSSWANNGTSIGDSLPVDRFIYDEADRILKSYGNHPSFCMMTYGNEPAGKQVNEFLGKLLINWKSRDPRHAYTSAAGWPVISENEFNLIPDARIQQSGQGLNSLLNSQPPQTMFDYSDIVSKYYIPVISHETGQWCSYPDFKQISKYSGVLKPSNLEIYSDLLAKGKMSDLAQRFTLASGKLQVINYKADIEAILRTKGIGGFQLFQIQDFPGQGYMPVGVLDPFLEPKEYTKPEEFRMFCDETVPLAKLERIVFTNDQPFTADIEIAHFGQKPIKNALVLKLILNSKGERIYADSSKIDEIEIGNGIKLGSIKADLSKIETAQKLTLIVSLRNTRFLNKWDFWVYPAKQEIVPGTVLVTDRIDNKTLKLLNGGGSVLLTTFGKVGRDKGAEVMLSFSTAFGNTVWSQDKAPNTLGILCDPEKKFFSNFPTEYYSNWQWWDPVIHSQAMIIDNLPADIEPLIQPIDNWLDNRKLALAFEARSGKGKILVCSIDLTKKIDDRPVTKQLFISMLNYMNSNDFNPKTEVNIDAIKDLLK